MVAVSGAVLAGGKGARLGTDKALLDLGGGTLLARVVADLVEVVDEVLVVGRLMTDPAIPARVLPDARPGAGSLGGVYTALRAASAPHCLIVACDMPFLNRRLLSYLVDLAAGYDLVIPRLGEWFEPLHAVYSRACLGPIEGLLAKGNLRILDFFPQVRVRYVDRTELAAFDPALRSFFNINTPEQLHEALTIIAKSEGNPA